MKLSSAIMSMKTYAQHSFPPIITQTSLIRLYSIMSCEKPKQFARFFCKICHFPSKASRATIDYLPPREHPLSKKGAHNVKKNAENVTF